MSEGGLSNVLLGLILAMLGAGLGVLIRFSSRLVKMEIGTTAWQISHDKQDDARHGENGARFRILNENIELIRGGLHDVQGALGNMGMRDWLEERKEKRELERVKRKMDEPGVV